MAFDAALGKVVLVGDSQLTWTWDGSVWTTVSAAPAPVRARSAMAYDSVRARVVLFGGGHLSDTWEWNGATWAQRFPANIPLARYGQSMAFDSERGRVVVFGGLFNSSPSPWVLLNDTWTWDGTDWSQDSPATSPSARSNHAMVFQAARGRLLMFGGYDGRDSFDDTWEYIQPYPASFTAYGSGCPGSVGTPTLSAVGTALPWIGSTFTLRLDNIGSHPLFNVPFVLVGFSRTAWGTFSLPFDLSPHGMPGCSLLAEPALAFTLPNQGGSATWTLALPNDPHIAGASLFVQGGVTDLAANPVGLVFSNAGEVAIGAR